MNAAAVPRILGITGTVRDARLVPQSAPVTAEAAAPAGTPDLDLKRMAEWSLHYLIRTPRPHLGYEPVFQCHPLKCPPVPDGHDVVVPCDTDARMQWEWYYMREVAGSESGRDVEQAFHRRMRAYVQRDGTVLAPPGCYNEADIHARFERKDYVHHVWGATKILHSLSLEHERSGEAEPQALARAVLAKLRGLARWEVHDGTDVCWLPGGMAAINPDGSLLDTGWSKQPAPIVEPLLTYYRATGDRDGLDFARAYAEGIMRGLQPGGIRFKADGRFDEPLGHSHATMHAVWGVNHLGVLTGERRYIDFARRAWDWMLSRGTGTGWFPAMPDSCNETCCVSDMISNAALFGHAGDAEHFDYVERYLRNYIHALQFIITPEFEDYYREINAGASPDAHRRRHAGAPQIPGRHHRRIGAQRLRERPARQRLGLRDVRVLCAGRDARHSHGVGEYDRAAVPLAVGAGRDLREHELFARIAVGRRVLVFPGSGPPHRQAQG